MRKIDFVFNNFNINFFLKKFKKLKHVSDFDLAVLVLSSVIDKQSIKKSLNYYKFYKGNSTPRIIQKYFKNYKNNFEDKNIHKFFINKNNLNNTWAKWGEKAWLENAEIDDQFYFTDMVVQIITTGAFFIKLKRYFEIVYIAGTKVVEGDDWNDALCIKIKNEKKFILINFYHHRNTSANDSLSIIKTFDKKPNINEILNILGKSYRYYSPLPSYEMALKNALFNKDLKKSYDESYNEDLYKINYENEDQFLNLYKKNENIIKNYINYKPEKYFYKIDKSLKKSKNFFVKTLKEYWQENPLKKIKDCKFYQFIMKPEFKWCSNKNFINEILYSCNDINGLLQYISVEIQESKKFKEEIRILKMFRTNNKKFLVKIFKTNKEKLDALAENYMPTTILNDPYLMMKLIKIDSGLMSHIGNTLKKNKSFMKKVMKFINN
jgi:hypothetical protein